MGGELSKTISVCLTKLLLVASARIDYIAPSGGHRILVEGGTKIFLIKFPDIVQRSPVNKVSFNRPGSRAHLRALEAIGFFFAEYAFSLFSRYHL